MTELSETVGQQRLGSAPALIALIQQGAMAQMACVAAELRLADLLADGPKHASELAQPTGSHAPSLHRLLRAIGWFGCVTRASIKSPSGWPADTTGACASWPWG